MNGRHRTFPVVAAAALLFLLTRSQASAVTMICTSSTDCYVSDSGYRCDVIVDCYFWPDWGGSWLPPLPPEPTIGACRGSYSLGIACADQTCHRTECLNCCESVYPCGFPCSAYYDYDAWAQNELCKNGCQAIP